MARNEFGLSDPSPLFSIYMQPNQSQKNYYSQNHSTIPPFIPKKQILRPNPPIILSVSCKSIGLAWNISHDYSNFIVIIFLFFIFLSLKFVKMFAQFQIFIIQFQINFIRFLEQLQMLTIYKGML